MNRAVQWILLVIAVLCTVVLCFAPAFAAPLGQPEYITLHWSEGKLSQAFPAYHYNITWTGKVNVIQTLSLTREGAHTWHRNYRNIGIAVAGGGDGPLVHPLQWDAMARLAAELLFRYNLPLRAVKSHRDWAILDGYGPDCRRCPETREDIGYYQQPVLLRAASYLVRLNHHELTPIYTRKVS